MRAHGRRSTTRAIPCGTPRCRCRGLPRTSCTTWTRSSSRIVTGITSTGAEQLLPRDMPVFCQPEDEQALRELGLDARAVVDERLDWDGIRVTRLPARHGSGRSPRRSARSAASFSTISISQATPSGTRASPRRSSGIILVSRSSTPAAPSSRRRVDRDGRRRRARGGRARAESSACTWRRSTTAASRARRCGGGPGRARPRGRRDARAVAAAGYGVGLPVRRKRAICGSWSDAWSANSAFTWTLSYSNGKWEKRFSLTTMWSSVCALPSKT